MAGCRNFLLLNDDRMTDGAVLAFRQAGRSAGRLDCRINHFRVTLRRDHFLSGNHRIADGALLSICQTSFRTGRCLTGNRHRLMAGCRNFLLRNDDCMTGGAMLAFRQARLGAGRSLCCVNDFGVPLGWNLCLCNEDFVADRAVLAFGQASLGAGCLNSRVNDFGMARRKDLFHTGYRSAADRALRTGRMTSLGAGSGLLRNFNRSMSSCVDCFGLGCIANCAGVGLDAGILTGRRGRDLALIPAVALGGNLFLRFDNRSADGAADAIRQTRFGTGCGLAHNGLLGMPLGRNLFLCNEDFVTDGAVLAFRLARLRAGRRNSRIDDLGVAGGSDCFGLGCIANCAGVGLGTGVLTGSGGGNHALIPAVALCRNGFTRLLYFITNLAIGIAGVAFLSAGRLTATTNLGQRVVILPAGLEGQIGKSKQFWLCPRRIIEFFLVAPFAHLDHAGNQPAIEGVTLASKATFGKRVILAGPAVGDLHRLHRAAAAVGVKGDGQLFKLVEYCREINVLMRVEAPAVDPLCLIIGSPAIQELIGVVFILGHCGFRVFLKPHIVTCVFLTGIVTFL